MKRSACLLLLLAGCDVGRGCQSPTQVQTIVFPTPTPTPTPSPTPMPCFPRTAPCTANADCCSTNCSVDGACQ